MRGIYLILENSSSSSWKCELKLISKIMNHVETEYANFQEVYMYNHGTLWSLELYIYKFDGYCILEFILSLMLITKDDSGLRNETYCT
jgi:hypothetical protein